MVGRNLAYKRTKTVFDLSVRPLATMNLRTIHVPRLQPGGPR